MCILSVFMHERLGVCVFMKTSLKSALASFVLHCEHSHICVFINTAAAMEALRQMSQSLLQLLATVSPSAGHSRSTE